MIKRAKFNTGFINLKTYNLLPEPEDNIMRKLSVLPNAEVTVTYKGTGRFKEQTFLFSDFRVKGAKAGGVLITKRDVASIRIKPAKLVVAPVVESEDDNSEEEKPVVPASTEPQVEENVERVEVRDENEGPGLFD